MLATFDVSSPSLLKRLELPLGRFAVLGNHDYNYGERAVADALERHDITVLRYERLTIQFQNHSVDIVGIPDANVARTEAYALLAGVLPDRPPSCLPMIRFGSRKYLLDLTSH